MDLLLFSREAGLAKNEIAGFVKPQTGRVNEYGSDIVAKGGSCTTDGLPLAVPLDVPGVAQCIRRFLAESASGQDSSPVR